MFLHCTFKNSSSRVKLENEFYGGKGLGREVFVKLTIASRRKSYNLQNGIMTFQKLPSTELHYGYKP